MVLSVSAAATASRSPFDPHWSLYPRTYVAPYCSNPIAIDGNIDKPAWSSVQWSDPFDDIRGPDDAPPSDRPTPSQRTRMKMMWDDRYLYVAALVESDHEVVAEFTERNSPIFQKDSDFEVFLDPTGSCSCYKELELNAINTVWNLMIDRPYSDGGGEYSGRIAKPGEERYFDVNSQKTATRVVQGKVNDPDGGRVIWSVELALAHSDTLSAGTGGTAPKRGDMWRINFSRVERRGDINWTWQPQTVWDPAQGRVAGKVNMHLPDAWGYVVFDGPTTVSSGGGGPPGESAAKGTEGSGHEWQRDRTWPARLAAACVYYAQRRYAELHNGRFASDMLELSELVDPAIVGPFLSAGGLNIQAMDDGKKYLATVQGPGRFVVKITDKRLTTVTQNFGQSEATKRF